MEETQPAEFGEALTRAREAAGLEIRDLAGITKIQVRYLQALEREEWSVVPRGVIGRGFVRAVAREVGVPAEELLALYRNARQAEEAEPLAPMPELDWKTDLHRDRGGRPVILALLFLVGTALGIWIWSPWSLETSPPVEPQTSKAPEPGLAGSVAEGEQPETPPTPVGEQEPEPAAPPVEERIAATRDPGNVELEPGETIRETASVEEASPSQEVSTEVSLEIQAVETTWVRVSADGGRDQDRVFKPGERRTYTANGGFTVKLGNAGGVRLFWNGEALKVPGKPGAVVTLSFPDALETLTP